MKINVQKCNICGTVNQASDTAGWVDVITRTRTVSNIQIDICPACSSKPISTIGEIVAKLTTPTPKVMPSKPATPIAQPAGGK